jgi:hypothetical protein
LAEASEVNRRHFLQAIGAAVAVTAGGIELLQLEVPKRTFFLPPGAGWPVSRVLTLCDGTAGWHRESKILYGMDQSPLAIARAAMRLMVVGTVPVKELAGLDIENQFRTVRLVGPAGNCLVDGAFAVRRYQLSSDHSHARIELEALTGPEGQPAAITLLDDRGSG